MQKFRPVTMRPLIFGVVLSLLSKAVENRGDLVAHGSGYRLLLHVAALLMLVAAAACFVRQGVIAWRSISAALKGHGKPAAAVPQSDAAAPPGFDPDAALARYLSRRPAGSDEVLPARPVAGFGRKRT